MVRIIMGFYFTLRLLQLVVPWVARSIGRALMWMMISMSAFWVGVPQVTHRMADELIRRATAGGVPTIWDQRLYYLFRTVAFLAILIGWIIQSFITVWIVKWIF